MPRNDRSDSLSVRGEDDPRRPLKALEQETEVEMGWSETRDTGGVEHQSRADREGMARHRRPEEQASEDRTAASEAQAQQLGGVPEGEASTSAAERERGPGPAVKQVGDAAGEPSREG